MVGADRVVLNLFNGEPGIKNHFRDFAEIIRRDHERMAEFRSIGQMGFTPNLGALRLWCQQDLRLLAFDREVVIIRFSHFESHAFVVVRGVGRLEPHGAPFGC
jgi:hypothetical protein